MKKLTTKHYLQKLLTNRLLGNKYSDYLRLYKIITLFKIGQEYEYSYILKNIIKKNNVIFDVGANIGHYACRFSKWVANSGHVYCFEPLKRNYDLLEKMISYLNLENVKTIRSGIGDKDAKLVISIPTIKGTNIVVGTRASFNHSFNAYENATMKIESVQINTIDYYARKFNLKRLDLIKSDTEGYDSKVIMGGLNTISKFRPYLLLEISKSDPCVDQIKKFNYNSYYIEKKKMIPLSSFEGEVNNVMFVPKEKVIQIKKYLKYNK